jgi:hypothetical protein
MGNCLSFGPIAARVIALNATLRDRDRSTRGRSVTCVTALVFKAASLLLSCGRALEPLSHNFWPGALIRSDAMARVEHRIRDIDR